MALGASGRDALRQAVAKVLDQSYERELPIEYRDLLKAYYEALAK